MGLITEEVEVKVSSKYIKYLKNLGYKIPMKKSTNKSKYSKEYVYDMGSYITIKVKDLLPNSREKVQCSCDYCGAIFECSYDLYTYNLNSDNPKTSCKECSQSKKIETNIMKYGAKVKPLSEESKKKIRETNLLRYGAEYFLQTDEYKEKAKCTNQNNLGVDYPTQSSKVKEKMRENNQRKYGVDYISQLDWVKEKKKETMIQHYGVEHCSQSEIIKEKTKLSNLQKYGVGSTLQVKEIREKGRMTMFKNQTAPVSKQQKYLCGLYKGELNYPIECYSGDIVLVDDMIDIEYSGGGHYLSIIYGTETEKSFLKRQITRYNILKRNHYKQIEIISHKDWLPSDKILLQMLKDAKQYFDDYPNHSWFEFDIDNQIIRNAENKDGVSYFYGELRKITKNDLESA